MLKKNQLILPTKLNQMKKLFLAIVSILVISASSYAADVPKAVADAFAKKFPAATNIKWGKENAKEYEAEFKLNGKSVSANFLTNGSWIETESEINTAELPAAVTSAVKLKYADAVMLKIFKIETAKGKITYETEFKTGNKKKELIFNAEGDLIK
jgi:opacity protein-like surface antigen